MKNLNLIELQEINGGHEGTAYEVGKAIGEVVSFASTFIGYGAVVKWGGKGAKLLSKLF